MQGRDSLLLVQGIPSSLKKWIITFPPAFVLMFVFNVKVIVTASWSDSRCSSWEFPESKDILQRKKSYISNNRQTSE